MKTYDTFTPNFLEMHGKIKRKPFYFVADHCKVWQRGKCIAEWDSTFELDADINLDNEDIEVTLNNPELSKYIVSFFTFSEISLNNDRVLWSNNLLSNKANVKESEPSNMSLFYYKGVLSRIYLNVYSRKEITMLEFTLKNERYIADIKNPVKESIKQLKFSVRNEDSIPNIQGLLKSIIGEGIRAQQFELNNLDFTSSSHQRYEKGVPVRGFQQCRRAVKVERNINGCEGYKLTTGDGFIVTILNLEGNNLWGNNVQVTPKPMRIISQNSEEIVLRGYQVEAMSPFGWIDFNGADYGLSIFFTKSGEIDKCVLHMHNRNTDIEYYK
ncbi:MAG: hypothetical protein ACRC9X_00975 [Bacteroidales bacterium]